jgi:hypothetical protein
MLDVNTTIHTVWTEPDVQIPALPVLPTMTLFTYLRALEQLTLGVETWAHETPALPEMPPGQYRLVKSTVADDQSVMCFVASHIAVNGFGNTRILTVAKTHPYSRRFVGNFCHALMVVTQPPPVDGDATP